ncbi:MAG TPA: tRNA (adenosine(37)-N6)-threonylcarbamoyltransferase complex ATPase subunit type 1 TsaE [Planctomycetota bacterium]|nr:tRNA (adenosine(37)-N6)-threonylcarbamoyltransferase complex ATPase subunit type 1 TsaE [Planctomycetota bacterium]
MAEALRFASPSVEATEDLGAALGARLRADDVVALDGELGAGKTAFVRGLARGLGVEGPVQSPTYILMNVYSGRLELYHFDAWMEGREEAFLAEGGGEWLRAGGVAAVEWAARVADWLPRPRLAVRMGHVGPEARWIELAVVPGPDGEDGGLEDLLRALPSPGEVGAG